MTRAVVFDIDGTLVDSVDLHAEAWRQAVQHFGKNVSFEKIRSQIGKGADQLLPVFFSKKELAQFGKALEKWRGNLFRSKFLPHVRAFPRVRELFVHLRNDGFKIALASSASQDEVEIYEEIAAISDLVEHDVSKDDVKRSKPKPDIFEAALTRLGPVKPSQVIAVGDTPWDAEAAAAAGLRPIGMLCGGFAAEDLAAAGCMDLFWDPADLLVCYDTSPFAREDLALPVAHFGP